MLHVCYFIMYLDFDSIVFLFVAFLLDFIFIFLNAVNIP